MLSGQNFRNKSRIMRIGLRCKNVPRNEEWLSEVVIDIDNQVVICNSVYLGPRKLAINQDPLQNWNQEPH